MTPFYDNQRRFQLYLIDGSGAIVKKHSGKKSPGFIFEDVESILTYSTHPQIHLF